MPQSLSESEVKEDDNETEYLSSAAEQAKKKKKKRKKKGGGKHVGSSARRSSEDNADVSDMSVSRTTTFSVRNLKLEERDSDGILETFSVPSPKLASVSTAKVKVLLNIQHKNLNAVNEMRRMFGSKVIQTEKASARLVKNKRSRNARVAAVSTSRNTWLVTPKETWQPVTRMGLSMNLAHPHHGDQVSSPTGGPSSMGGGGGGAGSNSSNQTGGSSDVIYFNFEHNKAYRALQERFLAAVESNDTENIVRILDSQPYHIDSLIQLGELCKMSEEMATAADLIEHVIYALESAFHPMFSLTAGNCRLDYRRQENRSLFVALFKHAQYLEGRACPRTALEIAKLIMTFDPVGDPLAMILAVDYYAIRSRQFEWLIELYREWEASHNLAQLPNMAYSYAMAEFYEERNRGAATEKADAALQYALLMFPGVLKPLLEEIGVQIDARVNGHNYFGAGALKTQPVALQQLTALYVCRSKLVWRDAELLPWLERNTNVVLDRVDGKEEVVAEYAVKRTARYKNPPREILRHIVLSDFKEKVPLMPFVLKETEPIVMYDPLPPHDSVNIYTRPKGPAAARTFFNRNASSLSMFFQSLLPSFSVGDGGGGEAAAPVGGGQAELAAIEGVGENINIINNNNNNIVVNNNVEGAVGGVAEGGEEGAAAEGENPNSIRSSLDTMNEFLRYFLSSTRPTTTETRNDTELLDESEDGSEEDEEDNDST